MNLRDYQQQCIDDLRAAFAKKHRRVLLVAPTGAGKTVMFSYLTQKLTERGNRVLLLAHRDFLLDQIGGTLERFGIPHGFIAAKRKRELCHLTQVAGVHTLKNRIQKIAWQPDWIICDEAHHATAGSWDTILGAYPAARVVGVTATPQRLDGKGLGDIFDHMVIGPRVQDLMDQGFLSRVRYYSPKTVSTEGMRTRMGEYDRVETERAVNTRGVTGHAVEWYRKVCNNAPAIAFCASIAHSENVAEGFRAAGYRWQALHSRMSCADNQAAIQKLGNGELHGVSSCDIISEGFDVPVVTAAILLRPTQSLGLHLQQIGRVLRPAPGKERAIVIDHVGNVAHCKANRWSLMHGKAEDDRVWSLDGREKEKGEAPVRRCEACFAIIPAAVDVCPECGHEREQGVRGELEQLDGDLEELPEWMPPPETGIRLYILNAIPIGSDKHNYDFADELIPKLPANSHKQSVMKTMRETAVRHLEYYIVYPKQENWQAFKVALESYMKLLTTALCLKAFSLSEFEAIAELNGYKPGWAYHRHKHKLSHVRS
jgi:superfamily II DNA or RNA helicase